MPVTKYLPDLTRRRGPENHVADADGARSGLVREPPMAAISTGTALVGKAVASERRSSRVRAGKANQVSNAGVAVVGEWSKVDSRPFARAVRERVLAPLGMSASDFEPTATVKKGLAEGLMWTYHGREFTAPTFELGEAPAGCMYSTATDLARFLRVLLADGKTVSGAIVKPETLKTMLTPQFEKQDKRGFGLGFFLSDLDDHRRAGHGGAIYGFVTELAFLPDEKVGVVVIANKDVADWVTYRLADAALRHLLAARSGKPLPPAEELSAISRDTARKLAGKYGNDSRHELIEAGGKLYHFGPGNDYIGEVWKSGDDLIERGVQGSGTRFTCDGATLTWPAGKGKALARVKGSDVAPPEPLAHFHGLIGEYGWDHNALFVFEKEGKLHAMIEWFFLNPLVEETKDVYAFPASGGLYPGEKLLFKRDAAGRATEVEAARVLFKRRTLDGEDGQTFRIKPLKAIGAAKRGRRRAARRERANFARATSSN